MNEALTLVLAWLAGGVLGAIFFGGLWLTVRQGMSCKQPAVWFLGSLLLCMAVALAGFYFTAGGHWERFLACGLGFVLARSGVTWLTRPAEPSTTAPEASHAPES